MKRTLALLLVCALGLGLLAGCSTGTDESLGPGCDGFPAAPPSQPWSNAEKLSVSPKGSEAVNEALASFGLKLLQKTREADKQSPLVSPLSVALALSMTANGADGNTLAQFQEVLGGGVDLEELNAACAQYLSDYQGLLGSSQCRIANSLWKDHSGGIYEDFVSKCRGYYSAQVYEAELSEPRIVDDLNGWVSDKTNKMIPQIIDQPFPEETACLLVNALYLKNSWLSEFDPLSTHTMDFHHAGGPDSQVEYLRKFDTQLSYLQGKGAQGVVLPYDDGRLAFVAILPDLYPDSPDLGQWLNNLEGNSLSQLIINREDALFVSFAMPKFTAEWSGSLTDILSELGLEDAFDAARADFSNLGDSPEGYYISQVIHATKIEVNEKGTEAAAATVVAAESGAAAPPQEGITLILDRPFLYGIVDLYTGVPLFLGTYE
ncbi:serpin family protein [Oscillospiraceae bacterium 44-5]|uniref:serpin family protein n=1 Tax=Lawsonibacter sp. JLR.KK007 TaxID=3114293 RepID=UPI002FF374A4